MGRKIRRNRKHFRGYDLEKVHQVLAVLKRRPSGLPFRELSRQARIPVATLSRYLNDYLEEFVESIYLPDKKHPYVRIVRLTEESSTKSAVELTHIVRMIHPK